MAAHTIKTFVEDNGHERYAELGGSKGASFRKRLELGTPKPDDLQALERAKAIAAKRRLGHTYSKIAEDLKMTSAAGVAKFVSQGVYKSALLWIEREKLRVKAADAITMSSPSEGRAFLGKLVPKALRRLELSLDSGVKINEHGLEVLLESKAADAAMTTVLDAVGLTGPESIVHGKIIHIDSLVINQLVNEIADDDAIADARHVTVDADARHIIDAVATDVAVGA